MILQKWIAQYIAAHGIHTRLVEAFVREASLCAATNRDETLCSFFAICRSANHYDLNIDISESEKDRVIEKEILSGLRVCIVHAKIEKAETQKPVITIGIEFVAQ